MSLEWFEYYELMHRFNNLKDEVKQLREELQNLKNDTEQLQKQK